VIKYASAIALLGRLELLLALRVRLSAIGILAALLATPLASEAARIVSIVPSSAEAGEPVTVTGRGLVGRNVQVTVGGRPATVTSTSHHGVTFLVPDGLTSGPAEVRVGPRGGRPATATLVIEGAFDPTFPTGSVQQDVEADADGCLAGSLVLLTTAGVQATLAAGTCLSEPLGAPVTGPVTIGIDDAGGVPAGSGLAGVVRLFVRRPGGELVPAALDPPAELELPLAETAPAGTWYTHLFVQGEFLAAQLPAEGPFLLEAIVAVSGQPDRLQLDAATVLGVGFEPAPAGAAGLSGKGRNPGVSAGPVPHTVSTTFPSDPSMPDPRVFQWQVINPQTRHIVAVGYPYDGIGANESEVQGRAGHPFTATLVPAGGPYRFEVTSDYANRFFLLLLIASDRTGPFVQWGDFATGGCAEEACTDQIYVGWVMVDVGALDLPALVSMRETLLARLPPGSRLLWKRIRTLPSGAMTALLAIPVLETSTQLLPPILPTRWAKVASDRTLSIDSIPLGVTVKHGTPLGSVFSSPVDGTGISWEVINDTEDTICCLPAVLPADAPPPVVFGSTGRTLRAFEPSPNVLAFEATGSGFNNHQTDAASRGVLNLRAELSFRRPGTLQIDIDPAWFQNGAGALAVEWTLDSGESARCEQIGGTFNCFPGASGAIPITDRGTRTVDLRALIGYYEAPLSSASGRAMTLRFTPSP
jgi:hypothetical protein